MRKVENLVDARINMLKYVKIWLLSLYWTRDCYFARYQNARLECL